MHQINKDRISAATLGLTAASGSSFLSHNSPSRNQMDWSFKQQMIPIAQPDIPRVMNCFESQLITFDIRMPEDGVIYRIIPKYITGRDRLAIRSTPYVTIIFKRISDGKFDYIDVYEHHSRHKLYGMKFVIMPIVHSLRPEDFVPKDTIFAKSPNKKEGDIYTSGISVNVINASFPCSIEDGYGVSRSFCKRAGLLEMFIAEGHHGKDQYPLNIYGTKDHFKAHPEIGDYTRPDGLIFAYREFNSKYDMANMTKEALMQVDSISDILVYGPANAKVYDMTVLSGIGESTAKPQTPTPMLVQSKRLIDALSIYYSTLLQVEREIGYGGDKLSPKLIQLFTRAYADKPNANHANSVSSGKIRRTIRNVPLDEVVVTLYLERLSDLHMGGKLTGNHGNKGVKVKVFEDEHMPVDEEGNRADVINFEKAIIARQNPGQLFEQFVGAASRDLSKWVVANYGVLSNSVIWERLLAYYKAVSDTMYTIVSTRFRTEHIDNHIKSIVKNGIYVYLPAYDEALGPKMYTEICKVIQPAYTPVTYMGLDGEWVTTEKRVLVGVQQMIVLEKTEQSPMSVSSSVLQHHGLLSGPNKLAVQSHQSKVRSVKAYSETETRYYSAVMGGDTMAKLLDLSNSPRAHKYMVEAILESKRPSCMGKVMGIPYGDSRPPAYVKNVLRCMGLDIVEG